MANLEVFYRPTSSLTVKVEVRDPKEMFQVLGPLQEILGDCKCGRCGGEKIRFLYRRADGKFDIYELLCETKNDKGFSCGAKLALGTTNEGNLFPRRYEQEVIDGKTVPKKDGDGRNVYLPNNGWVKWDHEKKRYV